MSQDDFHSNMSVVNFFANPNCDIDTTKSVRIVFNVRQFPSQLLVWVNWHNQLDENHPILLLNPVVEAFGSVTKYLIKLFYC